ncbi:RNA-guided endonuclease TnpB family protein [Gloeocapsa sp. PCC 73106]|uniref:RNA-guided endonuclease InsQ/TnpB family protein n=2 Tax=Gloeocapsa sp. PCC 73106 TaxID=102232 RepID=UPI0002AC4CEA|nr:RNA-guided endonuclease TnpB family protein [Gloeocapsa sp. PCC 73106]ELR99876.1 transposase, IS605 OrfB family, central region [Gloeocapsa sp. PCC 73106]
MKSRYNYRVYPTSQQKTLLSQLFGCTRVVWNDALAYCQQTYTNGETYPGFNHLSKKFLTQAKKNETRNWLKDVSSIPLQQSLKDLDTAFHNFFSSCNGTRKGPKLKPPRFKKRKSNQSARFTKSGFKIKQNKVYVAKIGNLKVIWSRPLPSAPSSVTFIKDAADRYFLSFVVEINPAKLPENTESVGIDLGILDFATLSNGEKIKAPKPLKARLKRLRKLQRKLSKKQKGSNRRERARKKVARLHAKIKDIRTDFLHKFSTRLIRENQTLVLEDLNTAGMVKNRKLSRAISDLGWRTFRNMLEAKAQMYGREFRIISRWEPTSQRCSNCGEIGGKKELSVREWTCLYCGAHHDRDINAAVNIKVAGGHLETLNGRGGKRKTKPNLAAPDEASTPFKPVQLSLF